jgi:zinc and cadmium transporter
MNFVGDGLHNFIDGVLIGAAFLVDIPTGITTSVAVLVHEIPQEIGDFGTLVWGGLPVRKALMLNFASALFALLGAVLVLMMGPQVAGLEEQILPLTAGGFIYIAGSDLIPELRKNPGARDSAAQLAAILVGLALIFVLTRFLSHGHTDEAGDGHEHTFLSTPLVLVDKLPAC